MYVYVYLVLFLWYFQCVGFVVFCLLWLVVIVICGCLCFELDVQVCVIDVVFLIVEFYNDGFICCYCYGLEVLLVIVLYVFVMDSYCVFGWLDVYQYVGVLGSDLFYICDVESAQWLVLYFVIKGMIFYEVFVLQVQIVCQQDVVGFCVRVFVFEVVIGGLIVFVVFDLVSSIVSVVLQGNEFGVDLVVGQCQKSFDVVDFEFYVIVGYGCGWFGFYYCYWCLCVIDVLLGWNAVFFFCFCVVGIGFIFVVVIVIVICVFCLV